VANYHTPEAWKQGKCEDCVNRNTCGMRALFQDNPEKRLGRPCSLFKDQTRGK